MILIEFIKNAFLYPPILKEWCFRLTYMYNSLLGLLIIGIILYIFIRYIILRTSKRKSEITKSIDENGNNINYSFFRSLWLILINKCCFLKHMIFGFLVIWFAWFFVSIFFGISAGYNTAGGNNLINNYSAQISGYSSLANDGAFLPMQFLQQHNEYLAFVLGLTATYFLICVILGGFFMTFSFNNKFIRNVGIFFRILGILIIFLGKLLDFYVIR